MALTAKKIKSQDEGFAWKKAEITVCESQGTQTEGGLGLRDWMYMQNAARQFVMSSMVMANAYAQLLRKGLGKV